jgi:ParB family transcriptional regulator, chromosome partitioning protein
MNKKAPRRVLVRRLSALIPTVSIDEASGNQEMVDIDLSTIKPNPFQPRVEMNDDDIKSLADSISTQGLLQPILVRQKGNCEFEIISGERRFRALKMLGRDKAPCIVKQKLTDREMMEIALVENIQREDLNEIEKADAYQKLILEYNYTHEALSRQLGKSRAAISNTLRLRTLPKEIQDMVRHGTLSMGHARALLALDDDKERLELAEKIVEEGLSVRSTETATQKTEHSKKIKHKSKPDDKIEDPNIVDALNRLQYRLGTAVTLKTSVGHKGKVEIEYFSEKDLTRIIDLLLASSP